MKDRLSKLIKKFCPTDECFDIIADFLVKLANDPDSIGTLEESEFIHNFKEMISYSSQDIMIQTLLDTYKKVKENVRVNDREDKTPSMISRESEFRVTLEDDNSKDFDMIDLSLIPSLDSLPKIQAGAIVESDSRNISQSGVKTLTPPLGNVSNDIELPIEVTTSSNVNANVSVGNEKNDEDDDINRFSTDASSITSETFTSAPKFVYDLDY